jgi:hypothetical protein
MPIRNYQKGQFNVGVLLTSKQTWQVQTRKEN